MKFLNKKIVVILFISLWISLISVREVKASSVETQAKITFVEPKEFPKTGEKHSLFIILGISIVGIGTTLVIQFKKEQENE